MKKRDTGLNVEGSLIFELRESIV